jgi:hypothetical protein
MEIAAEAECPASLPRPYHDTETRLAGLFERAFFIKPKWLRPA